MKGGILLVTLFAAAAFAQAELSRGVVAFEERKWPEAMEAFLETLRQDPGNAQAHAYVTLIAREMEAERRGAVRADRLEMLGAASKKLDEDRRDFAPLQQAIFEAARSEKNAREEQWQSRCQQARMERNAGHLLSANDLILQILSENGSYPDAQLELSELQSQIRSALEFGMSVSIPERFALEGFYSYDQADYAAALAAWGKVRAVRGQNDPGAEGERRLKDLHFTSYEKIAQAHVDEEQRVAGLKTIFDGGVTLYQGQHFTRALEEFRKLAIKDPEYPQLGYYLVKAEAAAERERTERLGEEKRQEIERALQSGLASLEKEQLPAAESSFEKVLRLDPSHPQARSYLAMVRAEMQKRHDPKAAQMHYEAGLIAYASGKLDEAMREWHMATRLNPQHEKALGALTKVQKELALGNRELTDEAVP